MVRHRLVYLGLVLLMASPVLAAAQAAPPSVTVEQIAQGCSGAGVAMLPTRMPEIPADKMTEAQKQTLIEFQKVRGTARGVFGPYVALFRSPEVLLHTVRLGYYLQFKSALPEKLKQFIIAITARRWTQQYMWNVHCPGAVRAGLSPDIAKALLNGRRPPGMSEDEELVYDFCDELHRNQSVSDATYARALSKFGEEGIVDMIGLNAYYSFLAMVANVARLPVGSGTTPNLPGFPR